MTSTGKITPRATPKRSVPVRRVRFTHPGVAARRHYVDGDLVMSHTIAVLSGTFPPGEEFFVRAVRHYRDRITDPELATQVRGFIGQEVVHGREHDSLNQVLREMGYPTRYIHRSIDRWLRLFDRTLSPRIRLGFTAALEHYTATIAECLLTKPEAQKLLGDTEVRSILLWHALEESEHKAVAFDVFRATGGSERMRIWTMRVISTGLILHVITSTILSLLGDRSTYNPVRLFRSIAALRHSPFLSRDVVRDLRTYNKPGFHPDHFDSTALLERWRAELFGPQGSLAHTLK